tara:strand:- start:492 stop:698 length:207 start_codon:yes stop_codon:yes gene_type:complete
MNDGAGVNFFCSEEWEMFGEVKPHLPTKDTVGSGSGAVLLGLAIFEDVLEEVEVLFHGEDIIKKRRKR